MQKCMIFLFVSIEYSRREFIIILKKNINVKLHVNKATISISREKKKHKRKSKTSNYLKCIVCCSSIFPASMDNLCREKYTTISYNTITMEKTKPQICFAKEFEMARN